DRPPRGQAEHLIAAAVGENRSGPADEAMQAATARDQIVAGPEVQMVGVAEEDLGAQRLEIAMRDPLHRALRADRHERRRLDGTVRGRHYTATRAPFGMRDAKIERHVLV